MARSPCEHKRDLRINRRFVQPVPGYAVMIESLDKKVGRLREWLERIETTAPVKSGMEKHVWRSRDCRLARPRFAQDMRKSRGAVDHEWQSESETSPLNVSHAAVEPPFSILPHSSLIRSRASRIIPALASAGSM